MCYGDNSTARGIELVRGLERKLRASVLMAVDFVHTCSVADENQGSQTLAVALSVTFLVYTLVAVALAALTLLSASEAPPPKEGQPKAIVDGKPVAIQALE